MNFVSSFLGKQTEPICQNQKLREGLNTLGSTPQTRITFSALITL
ncbi:hypothetical protein HanPSC8_Chr08g0315021 [Helianthus annuus]|nr:hypothetical protein HanPSC8_Chr08g0315021 [Helianthus annuus]